MADKESITVVLDRDDYFAEANRQQSDSAIYHLLSDDYINT